VCQICDLVLNLQVRGVSKGEMACQAQMGRLVERAQPVDQASQDVVAQEEISVIEVLSVLMAGLELPD